MNDNLDRWTLAKERAAIYAPLPPINPITAGVAGVIAIGVAALIFTMAGAKGLDQPPVASIAVAIAFALPYGLLKWQEMQNRLAVGKEYENLLIERGPLDDPTITS
jgi:hypothetical protein